MRRLTSLVLLIAVAGCGGTARRAAPTPAGSRPARHAPAPPSRPAPVRHLVAHAVGHLPAPVQLPAVTSWRHGLLAAGGLDAADASVADVVRVRADGRAAVMAHLPAAEHDAAAATVGGRAYLYGGGDAGAGLDTVLRLTPGAVRAVGTLPAGASDVSAATVGGTAYVVGGYTGTVPLRSILAVRPGHAVQVAGRLPRPLRYAAVAAVGGDVLIAGGTSGTTARREVLRFDPTSGRVRRVARLPAPLTHAAAAAVGGRFYVLGGRGDALDAQHAAVWALDGHRMVARAAGSRGRCRTSGRRRWATGCSPSAAATPPDACTTRSSRWRPGREARRTGRRPRQPSCSRGAGAVTARRSPPRADRHGARRPRPPAPRRGARVRTSTSTRPAGPACSRPPPATRRPTCTCRRRRPTGSTSSPRRRSRSSRSIPVGRLPQHVTPSWDLKTLWVSNDEGNSLTPISPLTGRPGRTVPVADPYNLYFTADGRRAIVVAEAQKALDFRQPHTMRLRHRLNVPQCAGVDHMDYTASGRYALVSCEFAGRMIVVDLRRERVVKSFRLRAGAMPQDVKLSPDGRTFYVADMASNGVWLIDARRMRKERFVPTGAGAHGLYPSRDSRRLFVSNRSEGTITVISFRTRRPIAKWHLPAGSSPDMGGVSASGRVLWLSGRYDAEVYAISTRTGKLIRRIPVGAGPHGMCVWPQPGRYSIGHTGILR